MKDKTEFVPCGKCGDMIEVIHGEGIESESINCIVDLEDKESPIKFFCTSCFQGEFGVDC